MIGFTSGRGVITASFSRNSSGSNTTFTVPSSRAVRDGQTGTVIVIQRFGSGLQLNIHFHTLVLDGVFSGPSGSKTIGRDTSKHHDNLN